MHWPSQHLSEYTCIQPLNGAIGSKVHSLSLLGWVQCGHVGHCMIDCAPTGQLQTEMHPRVLRSCMCTCHAMVSLSLTANNCFCSAHSGLRHLQDLLPRNRVCFIRRTRPRVTHNSPNPHDTAAHFVHSPCMIAYGMSLCAHHARTRSHCSGTGSRLLHGGCDVGDC
jgi:hypothetical protein